MHVYHLTSPENDKHTTKDTGVDIEPCWKPSSLLSNVHFRNTTKIAVQVLLLLTLFTFTFEPFLKL